MKTHLSKDVTIADYRRMEAEQDRAAISQFLRKRFTERYITPMRVDKDKKNGFTIIAVSCLMIEALESFYHGWTNSRNKSQLAFCNFFDRDPDFNFMRGHGEGFYRHVRCGILHQAETTGGWHIRRRGKVFEESTMTINTKLFHDRVENALRRYCDQLEQDAWNSELWKKFRKKMNSVCANCEVK
ncbi:MAG: hypothetical protein ACREVE_15540 [Gammaproteobacteria bacterium]